MTDEGTARVARQVERALTEDDRAEVLEWVARAVEGATKTLQFTLPGGYRQSIQFVDPYQLTSALRMKANELKGPG
jgi:hypothetical protein